MTQLEDHPIPLTSMQPRSLALQRRLYTHMDAHGNACQWSQGRSSGTASINSINGLMLHVPFIFCNIFQQLSNDVLLKLYKHMVTLTIVDDNLYKTQRMVSEYVLLARVNGTELACSNRTIKIVFTKPKRNPAWVLNSCMDILSILCCDIRAPV